MKLIRCKSMVNMKTSMVLFASVSAAATLTAMPPCALAQAEPGVASPSEKHDASPTPANNAPAATPPADNPATERLHPEADSMVNERVLLELKDGTRIAGILASTDDVHLTMKKGQTVLKFERSAIAFVKLARKSQQAPSGTPNRSPAPASPPIDYRKIDNQDSNDSSDGSTVARMRGAWFSGDISLIGYQRASAQFVETYAVALGLVNSPLNIGIGYQSGHLLGGVRLGFQATVPERGDTDILGRIVGRFEFVVSSGDARPFVALEAGGFNTPVRSTSYSTFHAGIQGGYHIFVGKNFSLDPYIEVGGQYLPEYEGTGISARLGFLMSGWSWSRE